MRNEDIRRVTVALQNAKVSRQHVTRTQSGFVWHYDAVESIDTTGAVRPSLHFTIHRPKRSVRTLTLTSGGGAARLSEDVPATTTSA